jgi:hypothetical protein
MVITLLFCVSWVIFFTVMLQLVDRSSSGRPVKSSRKSSRNTMDGHSITRAQSETLYLRDWTEQYEDKDWARRRLS